MFFCQYWNTSSCLSGRHCNNNCWSNLLCLSSWKPYILYNICCFKDKNRENKKINKNCCKMSTTKQLNCFFTRLVLFCKTLVFLLFLFSVVPFLPFCKQFSCTRMYLYLYRFLLTTAWVTDRKFTAQREETTAAAAATRQLCDAKWLRKQPKIVL